MLGNGLFVSLSFTATKIPVGCDVYFSSFSLPTNSVLFFSAFILTCQEQFEAVAKCLWMMNYPFAFGTFETHTQRERKSMNGTIVLIRLCVRKEQNLGHGWDSRIGKPIEAQNKIDCASLVESCFCSILLKSVNFSLALVPPQ